jgi:hypothetical protein
MTSCIERLSRTSRLHLAALAVAGLALFVALGGTSYAAGLLIGTKQIKNNAVTSKKIKDNRVSSSDLKNNGVQSADIADGTLELTDLSGPLQAKVNDVAGGLVDTAQLANGAVTNPKLAPNSVSSSKVAPNSLGSGDLGSSSVASSEIATGGAAGAEIATNAVQGDEVENGSLTAADVGQYSGSANRNFGAIPAGACGFVFIDPVPGPGSIDNRVAVVTPGPGFAGNVSFHVEAEGPQLRLKACNSSGGPVDPDGAGTNYNYIVLG